jgi:acetylornithine deacetylase
MIESILTIALLFSTLHVFLSHAQSAPTYRDELLSLHKALVDIPSITGNETEVGNFLIDYLKEKGLVAEAQPISSSNSTKASRFNVVAWPENRPSNWSKVVVTTHIDVVPPYIPYSRSGPEPPTAETLIAGRGTVDAKGSVATQIVALLQLLSENLVTGDDVMLVFVVGEEKDGVGMKQFSSVMARQKHRSRAAIFGEPTEALLACGHKGILACQLSVKGKAGHSGYPSSGKSANEVLMRGLIKAIDTDLGQSEAYGNTTLNIGVIEGGIANNVIPAEASANISLRVAIGPSKTGHEIVKKNLQDVLTGVDDEAFKLDCGNGVGYGTIPISCDVEGKYLISSTSPILAKRWRRFYENERKRTTSASTGIAPFLQPVLSWVVLVQMADIVSRIQDRSSQLWYGYPQFGGQPHEIPLRPRKYSCRAFRGRGGQAGRFGTSCGRLQEAHFACSQGFWRY